MNKLKVVLVGNPNVGKTALLNALTGRKEKTGNWPGVTVQKRTGMFNFRGVDIEVIDLPGVYTLSCESIEEKVARDFLISGDYDVVVNIVDGESLEKSFYLTLELLEMGINPIVAVNKIDAVQNLKSYVKNLSKILGLKVVPVSAITREGLEELSENILKQALEKEVSYFQIRYPEEIENAISLLELKLQSSKPFLKELPKRWIAVKLLENDKEIENLTVKSFGEEFKELLEKILSDLKNKLKSEPGEVIIKTRFETAKQLTKGVFEESLSSVSRIEDCVDKFLTHPLTGIPAFALIMFFVFKLTFLVGDWLGGLVDDFFSRVLPDIVKHLHLPGFVESLVNDGILAGIGAVLTFLPLLATLYFLMAFLEDTGYMARASALWDNFVRIFGLNGASVIPLILGFGCNVPAVFSTRTIKSEKKRLITMMIIPWISCSARLPVYVLFTSAFFKEHQTAIVISLYFLGIFFALLFSLVLSKVFPGDEEFFIELPRYRLPSLRLVLNQTYIEVREFFVKAGTVILAVSVVIWILASLPPGVPYASESSVLGSIGKKLVAIFSPMGIEDWKPVVALITGAIAKEVVVGTLGTLYGNEESLAQELKSTFTPESAIAFMIFTLLYIPCIATIASIKQETGGWKYPLILIGVELVVAWLVAVGIYNLLV